MIIIIMILLIYPIIMTYLMKLDLGSIWVINGYLKMALQFNGVEELVKHGVKFQILILVLTEG